MADDTLAHEDLVDIQVVLFGSRQLIAALHSTQGAIDFDNDRERLRMHYMLTCLGLMKEADGCGRGLADKLRRVIDDIRAERPVCEMTIDDFGVVASRYSDWLPLPLSGTWRAFFYDFRVS